MTEGRGNDFPKIGIKTQDLIDVVEADLKKARRLMKKEDFGAVNWGDLGVSDVEYRMSLMRPDDGPICVVVIEEASPDCKLAKWLSDRLDRDRFPNTYIECEW
jgi:hypothetical protein